MSEMDDLFALARAATVPPAGAKERVLARVLANVPPTPSGGGGSGLPLTAGGASPTLAGVLVFALAAAVGGGIYLARTRQAQVEPVAVVSVVDVPPPPPAVEVVAPPSATAIPSAIAIPSTTTRTSPTASVTDSLAEEVRIIREAKAALGAGDAAGAIRKLDEHAKRFKSGKLAQEREVTRVRALCKQGKIPQAKALYRALSKGAPSSPHLASLRASCPALEDE
jgi:hypothetical protein